MRQVNVGQLHPAGQAEHLRHRLQLAVQRARALHGADEDDREGGDENGEHRRAVAGPEPEQGEDQPGDGGVPTSSGDDGPRHHRGGDRQAGEQAEQAAQAQCQHVAEQGAAGGDGNFRPAAAGRTSRPAWRRLHPASAGISGPRRWAVNSTGEKRHRLASEPQPPTGNGRWLPAIDESGARVGVRLTAGRIAVEAGVGSLPPTRPGFWRASA